MPTSIILLFCDCIVSSVTVTIVKLVKSWSNYCKSCNYNCNLQSQFSTITAVTFTVAITTVTVTVVNVTVVTITVANVIVTVPVTLVILQ